MPISTNHVDPLMRLLFIEAADEVIEAGLLLQEVLGLRAPNPRPRPHCRARSYHQAPFVEP